ncbi:MAG: peptidyl-prolyl cis-trans isomerase [Verrucomicrobiota bacterium]
MNRSPSILIVLLSILGVSCKPSGERQVVAPTATGDVLAVVGDERITAADFQKEMSRRSADDRAAGLEQMIRHKTALVQARAAGFDKEPEMVALVEQLIASRFLEARHAAGSRSEPVVSEEEINRFYQNHRDRFQKPESVRAGVIYLRSSARADVEKRGELRERATAILDQARGLDPDAFVMLVRQNSEDQATRYTGGDTGWMRPDDSLPARDAAVVEAAAALRNPGDMAPLLESADGFRIVRLTARQAAGVRPLDEVREAIRYELLQSARAARQNAFFEKLKEGVRIEINEPLLQNLALPDTPSLTKGPLPLPGN